MKLPLPTLALCLPLLCACATTAQPLPPCLNLPPPDPALMTPPHYEEQLRRLLQAPSLEPISASPSSPSPTPATPR